jgi:hypothetical protein
MDLSGNTVVDDGNSDPPRLLPFPNYVSQSLLHQRSQGRI